MAALAFPALISSLAGPALAVGTAASAIGTLAAAGQQSAAADFEAQQYKAQADAARTASMQDEAARRRDLTSNLMTIAAIRAGRGVGATSPTAMAIFDNAIDRSEDDIQASKANYAAKADLASRASVLSERKGKTSLFAGFMGAAGSVGTGIFRLNKALS